MNEAVTELKANIDQYQTQIKQSREIEKTNKQKTNDIEYKIKNAAEIKKKEQKVRIGLSFSPINGVGNVVKFTLYGCMEIKIRGCLCSRKQKPKLNVAKKPRRPQKMPGLTRRLRKLH